MVASLLRQLAAQGFKRVATEGGERIVREVTPEVAANLGILRNALSNADNVPAQVADALQLGPATNRIARQAYGGDGAVRGGLIGTTDIAPAARQAPVPEFDVVGREPTGLIPRSRVPEPPASVVRSQSVNTGSTVDLSNAPAPTAMRDLSQPNPAYRQGEINLGATRNPAGTRSTAETLSNRGRVTPAGTNIGGRMYTPESFNSARNQAVAANRQRMVDAVDAPARIPPDQLDLFGAQAYQGRVGGNRVFDARNVARNQFFSGLEAPGGGVARTGVNTGLRATQGPAPTPAQIQAATDAGVFPQMATAANTGSPLVDLSNPAVRAMIGGGAVGLGVGTAVGMRGGNSVGDLLRETGQMPMIGSQDEIPAKGSVTPDAVIDADTQTPLIATEDDGRPLGDTSMATPATGPNTIVTRGDGGASDRRAAMQQSSKSEATAAAFAEPRDPSEYASPSDYFAAVAAYANQNPVKQLMKAAGAQESKRRGTDADLAAWAEANPALMYQLQQSMLRAPELSEQTGDAVTTSQVVSQMGPDSEANAVGYGVYGTAASQGDTQASDIEAATAPIVQPKLERVSSLLLEEALRNVQPYRR